MLAALRARVLWLRGHLRRGRRRLHAHPALLRPTIAGKEGFICVGLGFAAVDVKNLLATAVTLIRRGSIGVGRGGQKLSSANRLQILLRLVNRWNDKQRAGNSAAVCCC